MKKEMLPILICLLLSFVCSSGCMEETQSDEESKIVYVDDDGGADFTKIQDAINHVVDGGTIFVRNGSYNEKVIIDKSINLIGESKKNTIIHYNKIKDKIGLDSVVIITADNCKITQFKIIFINYTLDDRSKCINIKSSNNKINNNIIMYANKGVFINSYSINNTITWNNISHTKWGITVQSSDNNISNNNISSCETYGIYFDGSDNNIITSNMIVDNNYGMRIYDSENNKFFRNTILNNSKGIYCCCGAKNNLIYLNNFKQNRDWSASDTAVNKWDNGNLGNFWDDYIEKYPDAIQIDGIWDTPYNITGWDIIDRFPLVNPIDI